MEGQKVPSEHQKCVSCEGDTGIGSPERLWRFSSHLGDIQKQFRHGPGHTVLDNLP